METKDKTLHILSNASGTNKELFNIKLTSGIGDIVLQLDGFNKQNESSKTCRPLSSNNVFFNSHHDIFQAILRQVTKTPQETTFLNILHYLLTIDPCETTCSAKWQVLEKLAHRVIQLENGEDIEQLLKVSICRKCHDLTDNTNNSETSTTPSPPPPPIWGKFLPTNSTNAVQKSTPKSTTKLKTYNWIKIPQHKILNKSNVWTIMKNNEKSLDVIDTKNIEELFSLPTNSKTKRDSFNKSDRTDGSSAIGKKEKQRKKLHLLDSQFSLKINIFLSQFKSYNSQDIVEVIRCGNNKIMDLEKLKDLCKFLQKEDSLKILKLFKGDYQDLGSAEKFLIMLLVLPNYKLRIDCMIAKEEFALTLPPLEPRLKAILKAGQDLMAYESLPIILQIIIKVGNYLNSGSYAGNAVGFKLSSLNKLTEIKANKTGLHLLHFIVMQVESYGPQLMEFYKDLSFLENVAKINIDQISDDIKELDYTLLKIDKQVQMPTTEEDIKLQMSEFLLLYKDKLSLLKNNLEKLDNLRMEMANFFCEDLATFKVNECFEIFHKFCEQFKQSVKDNERRQRLEKREAVKHKPKEVVRVSPLKTKPANVDIPTRPPNLKILLRNITTNKTSKQLPNNNDFLINEIKSAQNSESKYNTQITTETENSTKNTDTTKTLPLTPNSPQDTRKSLVSLKTLVNITRFGKCYAPIKEEDLKKAIDNLRPPIIDTNRFHRRYTMVNSSQVELRNKRKEKEGDKPNLKLNTYIALQRRNTVASPPTELNLRGHRYSSINEADLKEAIQNLRPLRRDVLRGNYLGFGNDNSPYLYKQNSDETLEKAQEINKPKRRNSLKELLQNLRPLKKEDVGRNLSFRKQKDIKPYFDEQNYEDYRETLEEAQEINKTKKRNSLVRKHSLRRYSSINDADLKEAIKNLRPLGENINSSLTWKASEEENEAITTEIEAVPQTEKIPHNLLKFPKRFLIKFQKKPNTGIEVRKRKNSITQESEDYSKQEKEGSRTRFRKRFTQRFKKLSPFKS